MQIRISTLASQARTKPDELCKPSHQAVRNGEGYHMGTVSRPCLETDMVDMSFDSAGRDLKLFGHFLGGQALSDRAKDFRFAIGQRFEDCVPIFNHWPESSWQQIESKRVSIKADQSSWQERTGATAIDVRKNRT